MRRCIACSPITEVTHCLIPSFVLVCFGIVAFSVQQKLCVKYRAPDSLVYLLSPSHREVEIFTMLDVFVVLPSFALPLFFGFPILLFMRILGRLFWVRRNLRSSSYDVTTAYG